MNQSENHRGRPGVLAPAAVLLLALCLLAGGAQALNGHTEMAAPVGAGETDGGADPSADLGAPSPALPTVPGTIQAEDYDLGGEGVAYHDTTPGNEGGAYRHDDVDIEEGNGITNVGWVRDGEFLAYTVNVTRAGSYMMTVRVASPNSGRGIGIRVDDTPRVVIPVPNTGSFATFARAGPAVCPTASPPLTPVWPPVEPTCYQPPILFEAGTHTLKLTFFGDGQNLDWMEFVPLDETPGPNGTPYTPLTVPGTIQAENYDLGGEGVAYHDTTPGNSGGEYRPDDVDIETQGGTTAVGWIRNGEWLTYTANVAEDGVYTMAAIVSSPNAGRTITVFVDGARAPTITVPNTGSFAAFQSVEARIALPAGTHTLRFAFSGDGQNLDRIEFTAPAQTPTPYVNVTIPGTIQAEDYDLGGEGVAYHDTTASNSGGAYRGDGVDVATIADGHAVVGIQDGEWLVYTIGGVSPTPRLPALVLHLGSDRDGGSVELEVNGRAAGTVSVPNTGSPTVFRAVQTQVVAAEGTLRLVFHGSGMGMDRIESPVLVATADAYNQADFTAVPVNGTAPLTVHFADTSSEYAYEWAWDFGDGATSTGQNPVHTFQGAGVYNVSLNVRVANHWLGGVYVNIWNDLSHGKTVRVTIEETGPAPVSVPGGAGLPADTDGDGKYEDVNGNGRADFADVVLFFNQMGWIAANEPVPAFDGNGNGRVDFADVVRLFDRLGGTPAPASVFSIVDEPEPGLYRFSAAEVQAIRRTTPYEWAEGTGGAGSYWTSRVDPMQILGMYPLLGLRDGFVLRAYITGDMMGANGVVFVLPAGQAVPGPGLPPGADLNFTEYIEVDGSPASYLEAVVCSIELRSFAEWWHAVNWKARAFLDSKPAFSLSYTGPEPATWSPTVRVGPSETRVVFHTLSSRTGVLEEHTVRFIPGTPGCEWSSRFLAYGGPGYTP